MKNTIWFAVNGNIYNVVTNNFEDGFVINNIKNNQNVLKIEDKNGKVELSGINNNDIKVTPVLKSYVIMDNNDYIRINSDFENEMIAMPIYENGKSCGVEFILRNRKSLNVVAVYDVISAESTICAMPIAA